NTIGETLTVQQRVDDVQSQIDRLEGQRRLLANQSDQATLTMTISEKPPAVVKAQTTSGLSSSWDKAKHGFSSGIEGLISRSGRALVVLLVLGIALVVGRFGWRLARRRML
ncbi:MAG: putative lipoprotein, partial [Frankiales bacterium]|nr:putative lipoprotein [Frankiales bacterium]